MAARTLRRSWCDENSLWELNVPRRDLRISRRALNGVLLVPAWWYRAGDGSAGVGLCVNTYLPLGPGVRRQRVAPPPVQRARPAQEVGDPPGSERRRFGCTAAGDQISWRRCWVNEMQAAAVDPALARALRAGVRRRARSTIVSDLVRIAFHLCTSASSAIVSAQLSGREFVTTFGRHRARRPAPRGVRPSVTEFLEHASGGQGIRACRGRRSISCAQACQQWGRRHPPSPRWWRASKPGAKPYRDATEPLGRPPATGQLRRSCINGPSGQPSAQGILTSPRGTAKAVTKP